MLMPCLFNATHQQDSPKRKSDLMDIEKTFIPKEIEETFKTILKTLIADYYNKVIEREKEICSFGVFTDSDISGFGLYFNTQSGIERITSAGRNWKEKNPTDLSEIDADKWWMPEWTSESLKDKDFYYKDPRYSQLEKIMADLKGKSNWDFDDEKNTFALYKREMFDTLCDVLKELKAAQLFKEVSNDFFLLVQEMDNGIYDGRAISLKKIMSEKQFEAYRKYNEA